MLYLCFTRPVYFYLQPSERAEARTYVVRALFDPSVVRGLEGTYLSDRGAVMRDRVNLLYADTSFAFEANRATLAQYADELRDVALRALEEEAILIAVFPVFHAE